MAIFKVYTPKLQTQWDEWVTSRPLVIQEMCKKIQPNKLYRLKTTDQRVTLTALNEDGTVTVDVTAEFNPHFKGLEIVFERSVFGIDIDDLEECDLPEGYVIQP